MNDFDRNILYDDWGNVRTVQFREGGQIEYVYTAEGEKLKKRVKTSTIPLTRSYGVYDDSQATLVQVDSVIYTGNLVLEQGESPKVLFLRLTMWIIVVWNIIRQ